MSSAEQCLDSAERKAQPCDNCGEVGRTKATGWTGGVEHVWCHDDDKSCYGYRTRHSLESAARDLGIDLTELRAEP